MTAASEDDTEAQRHRKANIISAHMGFNVLGLCVALVARPKLLSNVTKLSPADSAKLLANLSATTAAFEFLINPVAGKLSDAWGRKNFLIQAPFVSAFLKMLVFIKPSKITIAMERCISGACTTIGGSTTCSAALADVIKDPAELGRAYAQLGTAAGAGVIVGPMLGAWAMGKDGNPRTPFLVGSMMSAAQLALMTCSIEETLIPSLRKKIGSAVEVLTSSSPLSFLSVYNNGSIVARLCTIASLQCFCEGKSLSDLNTYYLQNEAKFDDPTRSFYLSCFGAIMTASGIVGKETIRRLGMRGHTTFQNFASMLGFILMGSTTNKFLIFSVLPVYVFAMERRAAMSSLAVKAAEAAGMGKGEFNAAFANLRAVAVGCAPLLYARVYAAGLAATPKSPGRPYFVAALIALIAELLHRTLTNKELTFA